MKKFKVPQIKIHTDAGEFGLRVERADLVQIAGVLEFNKQVYKFVMTLTKRSGKWVATEASMKGFSDALTTIFSAWADTHPSIFQFADRVQKHNSGQSDGHSDGHSGKPHPTRAR